MTKTCVLPAPPRRDDITDLHFLFRHDHPVDQQLDGALTFDLEAYHGLGREALTLREAGIEPGMTLEVVPLSGSNGQAG